MSRTVIFDLNGVFLQSQHLSNRFAHDYGVPTSKFLPVLKEIMAVVRQPKAVSTYSLWQPHLKEWGVSLNEEDFYTYWFSGELENKEMIALVRELKDDGWRLILLSNNFKERTQYYRQKFSFLDLFDKQYFSWETGLVKPSLVCFKRIIDDLKLSPENCYYFDDSQKNVAIAQSLGIQAFLFKDAATTRKILFSVEDN